MIKAFLFDLDGTLLLMDLKKFLSAYYHDIGKCAAANGFDPDLFLSALQSGTKGMMLNEGAMTNEQAFWQAFGKKFGSSGDKEQNLFMDYYLHGYQDMLRATCRKSEAAVKAVDCLRKKGYPMVLATNPFFPLEAVMARLSVVGIDPENFVLITTYDNCCFSKPSKQYFQSIAQTLGIEPENCMMVGNDCADDMPAAEAGMQTWLVTDNLINQTQTDITQFRHGDMSAFLDFISELPDDPE